MRNNFFNILFGGILIIFSIVGCDVSYNYDFENGYDDYVSDSANVTVDTLSSVDESMFAQARIFPGMVDSTERRIQDTTIMINLAFKYVDPSVLNVTSVPLPIYSTGLYAGPGELIKITVPISVQGLSVQIGSQMDDLTDLDPAKREPIVYTRKALFPGLNTIRSPLGGYIWIRRAEKATGGMTGIVFSGVCKAPDFILGVTDPAKWKNEILHSSVPWLELRSDHAVFSVSRSLVQVKVEADGNFAGNVEKVMSMWNESFEKDFYYLYGLTAGNDNPEFRAPDFPERVVLDVQLEDNDFVHWSGQPVAAMNSDYWIDKLTDINSFRNGDSWGIYTAFGNNYNPVISPWWSAVETAAAKLPLYKAVERNREDKTTFPDIFPDNGIGKMFPKALSYAAADSSKLMGSDDSTSYDAFKLLPLVQVGHFQKNLDDEEWTFYNYMFYNIRSSDIYQSYSGSDLFYKALCEYYQKSFSMFFDHWGIPISDYVRKAEDSKYDLLNIALWKYDPISETYQGNTDVNTSDYHYRYIRTNWTAEAYDSLGNKNDVPDDDRGVEKMFDGDRSTYWHSYYDDPISVLPFYIDIDMKAENQVDGFYIANGDREYRVRRLIISTSETGEKDGEWTKILEIKPFYECENPSDGLLPNVKNTEFFDLPLGIHRLRYLRLEITEPSYSYSNYDSNGLYDFDKDLNAYLHVNEGGVNDTIPALVPGDDTFFQTIAEFGTYYYKK